MVALLKRIPLLRQFAELRAEVTDLRRQLQEQGRIQKEALRLQLLSTRRYHDPRRLSHFEAQVLSQNGEDGVLAEIFTRIGTTDRRFVECGVGNGLENNTAYLLMRGWRGDWFELDETSIRSIRQSFSRPLAEGRLRVHRERLTMENGTPSFERAGVPPEFDLLSLDIDRNTSFLWQGLSVFRPRVVVIEYNSNVPPSDVWTVEYDAALGWNRTLYFGASLKALEGIGRTLGYTLVGCETSGVNAFFVRDDLVGTHFSGPFTAEFHYEPPRYYLARTWGHRRAFTDLPPATRATEVNRSQDATSS
jgi:hypothetical protein